MAESGARDQSGHVATVLFDYGGVIQELMDDVIATAIADHIGISRQELLPHYRAAIPLMQLGRLSEEEFFVDLSRVTQSRVPEHAGDLFTLPFAESSRLYPEMTHLLDDLVEGSVQIAVLSNTIPSHARLNRQRDNYRWFGNNVFLSCEMRLLKPDPESFRYAAKSLNHGFDSLLLVDDSEENIRGAQALKLKTIQHDSKTMSSADLRSELQGFGIDV